MKSAFWPILFAALVLWLLMFWLVCRFGLMPVLLVFTLAVLWFVYEVGKAIR